MPTDDEPARQRAQRTFRSFGNALGGFARRVGEIVSEVSEQLTVPDEVRVPLATARQHRVAGELDQALDTLTQASERTAHTWLDAAVQLCMCHAVLLGQTIEATTEPDEDGPAAHLLRAARSLPHAPDTALDHVRRATRGPSHYLPEDERELGFLAHLVAAHAHEASGHGERAVREFHKAWARRPTGAMTPILDHVRSRGVARLLAEGHAETARAWVSPAAAADELDPAATVLYACAAASMGDGPAADAALERLERERGLPEPDLAQAYLATSLPLGRKVDQRWIAAALARVEADPSDWAARRRVALAHLSHADPREEHAATNPELARGILVDLLAAAEAAAAPVRDQHLRELAHAALRLDTWPSSVEQALRARVQRDGASAPDEVRIAAAIGRKLQAGDPDFEPGPPPSFRPGLAALGPRGPDALSPLRDPGPRRAVESAGGALASAAYCRALGDEEGAQEHLVRAIVEAPGMRRAATLLSELAAPTAGNRLEDLLSSATTFLVRLPPRILGIDLDGVAPALGRVLAARERLARPLTIAIMGEFSSGKSTFVNALIGEEVAPMGLLPTTCTINVFRRGASGVGRVHYRDGTMSTLDAASISPYLAGLDAQEANRIHHVEVERAGTRLGDAAVVDTPGLNALDPYHEKVARDFLDEADAVVWIFAATRGGAASEGAMLTELRAGGRKVLGVLNKVDTLEDAEKEELSAYLADQLGEVLVDVIPLSATAALAHRTSGAAGGDPFEPVDRGLESHFLAHARELKRSITARRLADAIEAALASLETAIDALEAGARSGQTEAEQPRGEAAIARFADSLRAGILALDDLLTRESLALGVVRGGVGLVDAELDTQDLDYLSETFRDAALGVVRHCLDAARRGDEGERVGRVLETEVVPWLVGHLDGRVDSAEMGRWLAAAGPEAEAGEASLRSVFRRHVLPIADRWHGRARAADAELMRTRIRDRARATSTPRAEALRLRVSAVAGLRAVLAAAQRLEKAP